MILRKVGRFYWLDIRIKGKRYRRSLRTPYKELALDRYNQKKQELETEYGSDKVKFSDFVDKYLEWAWATKPMTAIREEQRLRIIKEILGDEVKFLSDVTPYRIEGLKIELRKRNRAKSTVNQYLSLLKNMFNRAIDWEIFEGHNPVKRVRFFKAFSHREALSASNLKKVMGEARRISQKPRSPLQRCFYDIMLVAVNTGMRKSEILNLKWRDIREDVVLIKGKGDKRRDVPINQVARMAIDRQPQRSEYVFYVPNRNEADAIKKTIHRIRKNTGVSFTFHILRHTFATMLLEKGVDIVTIGSILGHSRITMSLLYSHTNRERKQKAVDALTDTVQDNSKDSP